MNEKPIIEPEIFLPTPQPKSLDVTESIQSAHNEAVAETVKVTEEEINDFLKVILAHKVSLTSRKKMFKFIAAKKTVFDKLTEELKDSKDEISITSVRDTLQSLQKLYIELVDTQIKQRVPATKRTANVVEKKEPEAQPVIPLAAASETVAVETKVEYVHTSLKKRIGELKTQIMIDRNVDKEKIKQEVESYIVKIETFIKDFDTANDKAKVKDFQNTSYKLATTDLKGLISLRELLNKDEVVTPEPESTNADTEPEQPSEDEELIRAELSHLLPPQQAEPSGETEPETEPENNKEKKGSRVFNTYAEVVKAIIDKDEFAREVFLNQHSEMVNDMQKEIDRRKKEGGAGAVNEFITRQQENINTLVTQLEATRRENFDENGRLIIALQSDVRELENKRMEDKASEEPEQDQNTTAYTNLENNLSPERMETLKTNPDLYKKIIKAFADYNDALRINASPEILLQCQRDIDRLKARFQKYEQDFGKDDSNTEFTPINLSEALSGRNLAIMQSNKDLFNRTFDAVELYNNQIKGGASLEILSQSRKKALDMQQEFKQYKQEFLKKLKSTETETKNNKKKPNNESFHEFDDDFELIAKRVSKDRNPELKNNPDEEKSSIDPTNIVSPETKDVQHDAETQLFFTQEGKDYSKIAEDIGFDTWFSSIDSIIKAEKVHIKDEIKDLDAWYQSYQESIPYAKKLDTIYTDIEKTAGQNNITLLTAGTKIDALLFDLYRNGDEAKEKIDNLFAEFQDSKNRIAQAEQLKKSDELRTKIEGERSQDGKTRGLRIDEVKTILEARGKENTKENIDDLIIFLRDINHNYDYYANDNENIKDDMMYLYKKYHAAKGKSIKETSSGDKKVKKLGIWSRLVSSINASWPSDVDAVDYSNTVELIKKVRDLNLVDRKDGRSEKAMENKLKMAKLISLCLGQKGLLVEHLQNPKSNKEAEFTDEADKESLKLFDSMMKTFLDSKYRGVDAKIKAEKILEQGGTRPERTPEAIKSSMETLFDDREEMKVFEKEATAHVYKAALVNLDIELTNFPKTGKHLTKLVELETRYNLIKDTLKDDEDSDGMTKVNLEKANLKLKELAIRHANKDTYGELSKEFKNYDEIINSPVAEKVDKIKYVKELIAVLEALKAKSGSKIVQNFILNGTIKKYQGILVTLNK